MVTEDWRQCWSTMFLFHCTFLFDHSYKMRKNWDVKKSPQGFLKICCQHSRWFWKSVGTKDTISLAEPHNCKNSLSFTVKVCVCLWSLLEENQCKSMWTFVLQHIEIHWQRITSSHFAVKLYLSHRHSVPSSLFHIKLKTFYYIHYTERPAFPC